MLTSFAKFLVIPALVLTIGLGGRIGLLGGSEATTVSVQDFGARGDDGSDDTSAIQAALDSGHSVHIPSGRYLVSSLRLASSGVTVTGPGTLVKIGGVDGTTLIVIGDRNRIAGVQFEGRAPAPTPGGPNDTLRIVGGDENIIDRVRIDGSRGSGVRIESGGRNRVTNSVILDVEQNSILIANPGANDNYVADNRLIGTRTQNNIFVTAADGPRRTDARISGNVILRNHCDGAYDTGIESGQNADRTIVEENEVEGSRRPAILLRDGRGVRVARNVIRTPPLERQAENYSAIAVVPLHAGSLMRYDAVIAHNRISGPVKISGIYVGGSDVQLIGNSIESDRGDGRSNGTGLTGYGITLAGAVEDVLVRGNQVRGFERGIDLNFDGTRQVREDVTIADNEIVETAVAINAYNCVFRSSSIVANDISATRKTVELTASVAAEGLRIANNGPN